MIFAGPSRQQQSREAGMQHGLKEAAGLPEYSWTPHNFSTTPAKQPREQTLLHDAVPSSPDEDAALPTYPWAPWNISAIPAKQHSKQSLLHDAVPSSPCSPNEDAMTDDHVLVDPLHHRFTNQQHGWSLRQQFAVDDSSDDDSGMLDESCDSAGQLEQHSSMRNDPYHHMALHHDNHPMPEDQLILQCARRAASAAKYAQVWQLFIYTGCMHVGTLMPP